VTCGSPRRHQISALNFLVVIRGAEIACPEGKVIECPYIPVTPFTGQSSGFAAFKYSGDGPNVPENWASLDCETGSNAIFKGCSYCKNECGGDTQSPVDINVNGTDVMPWIPSVKYSPAEDANVTFAMAPGGYKLNCAEAGSCGSTTVGDEKYDVLQVHTHQQSEHSINGTLYPSELHVVHVRNGTDLLVVGVLFKEGAENADLADFITIANEKSSGSLNLLGLIGPALSTEYLYIYQGSLTTPPCSEGVRWTVSTKILEASAEQLLSLIILAGGKYDNRPVQPMNSRILYKL